MLKFNGAIMKRGGLATGESNNSSATPDTSVQGAGGEFRSRLKEADQRTALRTSQTSHGESNSRAGIFRSKGRRRREQDFGRAGKEARRE